LKVDFMGEDGAILSDRFFDRADSTLDTAGLSEGIPAMLSVDFLQRTAAQAFRRLIQVGQTQVGVANEKRFMYAAQNQVVIFTGEFHFVNPPLPPDYFHAAAGDRL